MSIKVTGENYSFYKSVFEIISRHLFGDVNPSLSPETNPVAVLNRWEAKSRSLARRGLQTALNDCLSGLDHCSKQRLANLNTELERNGLPNIHSLSGVVQKTLKQVLKAGKIKNIDQYYIVKEILDDTASEVSARERIGLSECLRDYESARSR